MEIDWKKTATVFICIALVYVFFKQKAFIRAFFQELLSFWHVIVLPFVGVGKIFISPHNEVFNLCLVAIAFITLIGLAKLIIRR